MKNINYNYITKDWFEYVTSTIVSQNNRILFKKYI